jgi:hypothetical protein
MAEFTKAQAIRQANAIRAKNPDFTPAQVKNIIQKQRGPLVFDGQEFYFKSTGRGDGSLAIESIEVRNARKKRSNTARNRELRRKTPTQAEFISEAKQFFEEQDIRKLDGKTARQYGIEQHRQARQALSIEKQRIKDANLSAGHIDPAMGGETLERPGNYFAQDAQENFADRNRQPSSRQREALQVRLPRQEAVQRMMGLGQDLPKFSDAQIDATLKGRGRRLGGVQQTLSIRGLATLAQQTINSLVNPDPKPSRSRTRLRIGGSGISSSLGRLNSSGSDIVDRVNAKMHLIAPYTPELELF